MRSGATWPCEFVRAFSGFVREFGCASVPKTRAKPPCFTNTPFPHASLPRTSPPVSVWIRESERCCSLIYCVALCCSVSQCFAVYRSVLQSVAVYCRDSYVQQLLQQRAERAVQCVSVRCSVLHCVALCCIVLQFLAVHYSDTCNSLPHANINPRRTHVPLCRNVRSVLQCVEVRCSALQCVAVSFSASQCVALCCSMMQ